MHYTGSAESFWEDQDKSNSFYKKLSHLGRCNPARLIVNLHVQVHFGLEAEVFLEVQSKLDIHLN